MGDHTYLVGAEDVASAGRNMKSAASEMNDAVRNLDASLERHQRFMEDLLQRQTQLLETSLGRFEALVLKLIEPVEIVQSDIVGRIDRD